MKKIIFGEKGGFPLEQETLIQLQEAYATDMLDALLARWGAKPEETYWISKPSLTNDGFIVTPISAELSDEDSILFRKPELLRILNSDTTKAALADTAKPPLYIVIKDIRTDQAATLVYGDGASHKVYEEYIAEITTEVTSLPYKDVKELPIDDKYLPRNGSKTMTGDLRADQDVIVQGKVKLPNAAASSSQIPMVINPDGSLGTGTFPAAGSGDASFTPGMIMMWGGNIPPQDWRLCEGGSPVNGITIPDLRSRFIVGYDSRDTSTGGYPIGSTGGANEVALTISEMPGHSHSGNTNYTGSHSHNVKNGTGGEKTNSVYGQNGNSPNFSGQDQATGWVNGNSLIETGGSHSHTFSTNSIGGNQAHENRPPYYALAFIIYVGDAGLVGNTPVISSLGLDDDNNNSIGNVGVNTASFPLAFKTVASDADGEVLEYSYVVTKPSGATLERGMSTDSEFGNLFANSFNENGTYTVTVTVTDGTSEVSTSSTFLVKGNLVQVTDFINAADSNGNSLGNTGPIIVNDTGLQIQSKGAGTGGANQFLKALVLSEVNNPPNYAWEFVSGSSPSDSIAIVSDDVDVISVFLAKGLPGSQRSVVVRCTVTYDSGTVISDEITLIYSTQSTGGGDGGGTGEVSLQGVANSSTGHSFEVTGPANTSISIQIDSDGFAEGSVSGLTVNGANPSFGFTVTTGSDGKANFDGTILVGFNNNEGDFFGDITVSLANSQQTGITIDPANNTYTMEGEGNVQQF